jgi:hypothetical protein
LAADGRDLLAGSRGVIRDPLLRFFGDAAQAVCVSAHLSDTLYLELRWLTPVEESPLRVAADRRRQLVDLPERVNDYLGQIRIDPYWQPLAIRYPLMVSFLSQQARVGVEGRCAVINAVLPAAAAHNLLLASELALASSVNADVPVSNSPPPAAGLSLDEILARPIRLTIEQQSLEAAVSELAGLIREQFTCPEFQLRIIGGDLQLDGITRNQQIRDVRLEDQTLRQVLTELVRRANPIAVESTKLAEQKLIWVVAPPEAGFGEWTVLITTRTAAKQKGYQVPPEFVAE